MKKVVGREIALLAVDGRLHSHREFALTRQVVKLKRVLSPGGGFAILETAVESNRARVEERRPAGHGLGQRLRNPVERPNLEFLAIVTRQIVDAVIMIEMRVAEHH